MSSFKLNDPHIEKVIINGQQTECVMSMASNVIDHWDNNFVESTDKQLIEMLRPYIVKEKGGDAIEPKELPKEISMLIGYKCVDYDLNGVFVKRYNDYQFFNGLITEENGVEYLEALPTPETGIWYIDKAQSHITFIDNMEPIKYSKVHFLCKYDYRNNKYADGWEPSIIGERIKSHLFIKYDPIKFPTIYFNHDKR
jgi:hypothetical protein